MIWLIVCRAVQGIGGGGVSVTLALHSSGETGSRLLGLLNGVRGYCRLGST